MQSSFLQPPPLLDPEMVKSFASQSDSCRYVFHAFLVHSLYIKYAYIKSVCLSACLFVWLITVVSNYYIIEQYSLRPEKLFVNAK